MQLKGVAVLLTLSSLWYVSNAQNNPSTWPEPTDTLIKNGFYTKTKLMEYWRWKKSTLPDLYIEFNNLSMKVIETKSNYTFSVSTLYADFVTGKVSISKEKQERLDSKSLDWLISFLEQKNDSKEKYCELLETNFKNIYIVIKKPSKQTEFYKSKRCNCPCNDDELSK